MSGPQQFRQCQPGVSNAGQGIYGGGPPPRLSGAPPLNSHHVAAVRAGAMQLLPPGYSANVTTINGYIPIAYYMYIWSISGHFADAESNFAENRFTI